ncbi:hypothetical protein P5G50_01295 [Leifsonia sp. F6_8S_P_1B]|uniref:AAA+ ATPase domain-containing protein n=1 Tax=Leifsonia williamsii TaxID=3035919 RepID=A0ABT8K7S3_9MICO|nr:hypothetical protein [Leifsonia williamsii]MDN4613072.1 hypothetical protein [Leifsonia williamsii]
MPSLLDLTLLERPYRVALAGMSDEQVGAVTRAWARCGARPADDDGEGATVSAALTSHREEVAAGADIASPDFAEVSARLTSALTTNVIRRRSRDLLLLHAAAVSDPVSGRTVALVGPSGRGKTTAARILAERWGYVTDETVAIRDDASVVPFPRPLSVVDPRPGSPKLQLGPDDLGLRRLGSAPRLSAILLLDRAPGDRIGGPRLSGLPLHEAVGDLVGQVSALSARPNGLRRLSSVIDACDGVRRVRYAEAAELAELVRPLLEWPTAKAKELRYAQAADAETLPDGDRLIVLAGGRVGVLDGIAPVVWQACARPAGVADLVQRVVHAHGVPAGGAPVADVVAVARALVGAGLLRRLGEPAA